MSEGCISLLGQGMSGVRHLTSKYRYREYYKGDLSLLMQLKELPV